MDWIGGVEFWLLCAVIAAGAVTSIAALIDRLFG
jgi:hypothetical protein